VFGAVAAGKEAGGFSSVAEAQEVVCGVRKKVYVPDPQSHSVYAEIYKLYRELHDSFGTSQGPARLDHVMKDLIAIRDRQRRAAR